MKKTAKNSKGKKRGIAQAVSDMPTSHKIAMGAAGVAVAAGAIAAGAVLSDKKTRAKVGVQAKKAFTTIQEVANEMDEEDSIHQTPKAKAKRVH